MAGELDLSARITADASGVASAGAQAEQAIGNVGRAAKEAASGAKQLEQATEASSAAAERSATATLRETIERTKAEKAAAELAAAEQRVAAATSSAERSAAAAALAQVKLANAEAAGSREAVNLAAAEQRLAAATSAAEKQAASAELAALRLQQARDRLGRSTGDNTRAMADNAAEMNRNAFGARNLGQQVGDFATQVSLGGGVVRAFSSQIGQAGFALSEMGGAAGRVGAFLVGPWGIALTVAALVAAPFVEKLFEASKAAEEQADKLEKAAAAADSYGTAQSLLGKVIDLTTGKLKTQNQVLIQTIRLQAEANVLAAQAARKEGLKGIRGTADPSTGETIADFASTAFAGLTGGSGAAGERFAQVIGKRAALLGPLTRDLETYRKAAEDYGKVLDDPKSSPAAIAASSDRFNTTLNRTLTNLSTSAKRAGRDVIEVKQAVLGLGTALNDQNANRQVIGVVDGGPIGADLKPYERGRTKKPPKPKSTAARDEFGRDAADRLANIVGQYGGDATSEVVEKTAKKIRELDDLIEDLGRRKPPNFGELIRQAEQAKTVIRDGLIRDVAEAFAQPKTLADKAALAVRQLDAVIADLEARKPTGFEKLIASANAAKGAVRDGLQRPYTEFIDAQREALDVQGLIAEGRQDEAEALQRVYTLQKTMGPLTEEQKDAVLATVQALKAQARQIEINRQNTAKYVEAVGGIKDVVEQATQAFVRGDLGQLIKSPKKLLDVFQTLQGRKLFDSIFGDLFRELNDAASGTTVVRDASDRMATAVDKASRSIQSLGDAAAQAAGNLGGGSDASPTDTGETVVTGTRPKPIFDRSIGGIGERIAKAFTSDENAKAFGDKLGKISGKAFGGAATGSFISGISNGLGIKMNSTGAQIGGAIGGLTGLPGGDIIGSIAGGLLGNLVKGPTRSGYAAITTNAGGASSASVSGGRNSDGRQKEAVGYADAVVSGLAQIAQALGGSVAGNLNLGTIGTQNEKFVFDSDGAGAAAGVKVDTLEEAITAALSSAIGKGAVVGLSEAMRKALASSTDVNAAIAEALKVKEVEDLIGGLGASLKAQFTAFDRAAAERVRVAKQYGLDVIAVEKLNAEQRTALVDSALKARVASLGEFLNSVKFGDLFEGTPADRRAALLTEIAKVQKDAEAGKDGAADQLSQLYEKLLSGSKSDFGTAGGQFSADRAAAISGVERVIQMEKDRVNQAAGTAQATIDALAKGNILADETNNLLAGVNARLDNLASAINAGNGYSGEGANFSATKRAAMLDM